MQTISIIIVNWNGRKWLKSCLDSLQEQTYEKLEIIVVDNASSDDSIKFIERNYSQVKLVKSNKNLGFAGGNNLGIDHASGEWIVLLNNDAWLEKDALRMLFEEAQYKRLDVIGAREVGYDNNKPANSGLWTLDYFGHPFVSKRCSSDDYFYLSGVCLGFKKNLYHESGGLDSDFFMYFEEIDWFWRLHAAGFKTALSTCVTVHHATHGSSHGESRLSQKRFLWRNQNALQMLLKNHRGINLIWVLPVYFGINIIEMLAFLLLGRFAIVLSYPQGWWFNLKYLRRTLKKRHNLAHLRRADIPRPEIRMAKGFNKILHLVTWFHTK